MLRRIHPLVFLLLVIGGVKLSEQLYRWAAYGDERAELKSLRGRLAESGAAIMRTGAEADSLRDEIRVEDEELEAEQRAVRRYNGYATNGALPHELYVRYREDLTRYNGHVAERNEKLRAWQEVVARKHAAVDRYNGLADSIRGVAERMGEPYYPVPTPLEAAVESGMLKPDP
ncbi:MAG TPA: hypothetical protein VHG91_02625 [Longimicrobium sp.]|nr:hypothetical protein [Longimicrobium sp.]